MFRAAYLSTYESGELARQARALREGLRCCELCPRRCRVNRLEDERGFCRTGRRAVVASYGAHFGEEQPLVGRGGSGTIFFTHCNLKCCFCQNHDISHGGAGRELEPAELAQLMTLVQEEGCHNVNLVTPSHVAAQILEALPLAIDAGLRVPLVYNTGGYDLAGTLGLLAGVVDIYMPDLKFSRPETARDLAEAEDYPALAQQALLEMHRQVGDLRLDENGLALRGMLVRHLVLPEDQAGTGECLRWLSEHLSRDTYVNLMDQYHPSASASAHPRLSRRITVEEYRAALAEADRCGLRRLDSRRPLRARRD
jgi:putative pyruvate formate lyase activating enzyme